MVSSNAQRSLDEAIKERDERKSLMDLIDYRVDNISFSQGQYKRVLENYMNNILGPKVKTTGVNIHYTKNDVDAFYRKLGKTLEMNEQETELLLACGESWIHPVKITEKILKREDGKYFRRFTNDQRVKCEVGLNSQLMELECDKPRISGFP